MLFEVFPRLQLFFRFSIKMIYYAEYAMNADFNDSKSLFIAWPSYVSVGTLYFLFHFANVNLLFLISFQFWQFSKSKEI